MAAWARASGSQLTASPPVLALPDPPWRAWACGCPPRWRSRLSQPPPGARIRLRSRPPGSIPPQCGVDVAASWVLPTPGSPVREYTTAGWPDSSAVSSCWRRTVRGWKPTRAQGTFHTTRTAAERISWARPSVFVGHTQRSLSMKGGALPGSAVLHERSHLACLVSQAESATL